ncbi:MAG TPA: glycosyltransferase family 1 protein [Acidimicrobiales bacterium]|nr:glycosyltransferase family 1 protein [Acidimicrobiales bacterium]
MLRVALDTRSLVDGSQHRGIGTYVAAIAAGLEAREDVDLVRVGGAPELRAGRWGEALGWWRHELRLPGAIATARPDVFHGAGQHPPRRVAVPWVQTLFDVIPLVRDDPAMRPYRARWRRLAPRYRRASAVIAISRAAAADGIARLGLEPSRVHVVPCGVAPSFRPPMVRPTCDVPYLLCVGAWGPHKGFAEAAAVAAALADAGYPHRLVIAGAADPWSVAQVQAVVAGAARPDRVDVVGFVDDIVPLYQGASALISTSRAEGFGLPAVEAMACATPVVAFDNTAQPEVVGDGGILVPDGDVAAMVTALRPLLDDERVWAEQSERALARAAAFDWGRAVDAHAEIYRRVLASAAVDRR